MTDGSFGRVWLLCGCLLLWAGGAAAAEVRLVTFGPEAAPGRGDEDHKEELFIRVPKDASGPLYVRVFDPDVGGAEDEPNGNWNTRTRFALFGGAGAALSGGGGLIQERVFGETPSVDGTWSELASIAPDQGDPVGDVSVFRLLVQGLEGDDGNLYDVELSAAPDASVPVTGAEILAERPAFSVPPEPQRFAEARIRVPPGSTSLRVRGFDLDRAQVRLETPFAAPTALSSSGDSDWSQDEIRLPENAAPQAAVLVRGGRKLLNDLVLEARDQDGKPVPFRLPIRLIPEPAAPLARIAVEPQADCRSVRFDASGSDGQGRRLTDYRWDFGDGTQGAGRQVRHAYASPGTYRVGLTVIDDSGRVLDRARTEREVKVNRLPEAVPGEARRAAPGEPVRFDASASSDQDGRLTGYHWDFGDGSGAQGLEASHAFAEPGRYQVTLSVEDDGPGPCTRSEAGTQVWVNAAPLPAAGPDRVVAAGEPVRLDAGASRDPDGEIRDYRWDLGDGTSAQGPHVEHAYARPGRYRVALEVTDDAGVSNSRAEDGLEVWVNDPPVAVASGPGRGAVGEPLSFDGSASTDADGELTQYLWDFGDGSQGRGVQVTHAYEAPGTYSVGLSVTDDSGASSATGETRLAMIVNAPPVADAGPDQWVTASQVAFDGSGSQDSDGRIQSWRWDFGDGASGEGEKPSHVYSAPGTYQVTLSVTDDSGTASATAKDRMQVKVNARPVADAGPDRLAVPGEVLAFDGSGSFDPDGQLVEYHWDFGDGTSASGAQVSHAYERPGRYGVGLEVRDDAGQAAALGESDALVRVNAPPVAVAGPDRLVAPGDPVRLDAGASYDPDGEIQTYAWHLDDRPDPIEGRTAALSLTTPGVVTATLEVGDDSGAANGQSEDRLSIRVNHPPAAVLPDSIDQCGLRVELGGSASRDPDGDRLLYRWDFGDGSPPGRGERALHLFPKPGRYPVTLTVDDGSGLANATRSARTHVWIHRSPVAVAEAPALACAGDLVLFNGTRSQDPDGGQLLYDWDFGDGSTAQAVSPVKRYERGGHYAVTLTVQNDSALPCSYARARVGLRVVDAPVAVAGEDLRVCAGEPVRFDGSASRDFDGAVNAYDWDFGDGGHGSGAQPTHLFATAGTYGVILTITGDRVGDCDDRNSDRLEVEVLEAPDVEIQGPSAAPVGTEIALQALAAGGDALEPGLALHWDFGDGAQATGATVTHSYATPGRYRVSLTVDAGAEGLCSQVERSHAILINAPPEAVAGPDLGAAPRERLVFDGSQSQDPDGVVVSYHWDFGDGTQAEGLQVEHGYEQPGVYEVELTVTDDAEPAGSASDRLEVRVNSSPVPRIQVRPEVPCPGEEVVLDAAASSDPDAVLTVWSWSLGDGAEAEGPRVSHQYQRAGRYSVTMTLTDDSGRENASTALLHDLVVNREPIAMIREPLKGCPGRPIALDASGSRDPDGQIQGYAWAFGDGQEGAGARVSHVYAEPGRHPVTLTLTDDSGSGCAQGRLTAEAVVNASPIARISASSQIAYLEGAHEAVLLDATPSSDPDGDPLLFEWDFGDGSTGRGPKVVHRYTKAGLHRVVLRARDGSGTDCSEGVAEIEVEVRERR